MAYRQWNAPPQQTVRDVSQAPFVAEGRFTPQYSEPEPYPFTRTVVPIIPLQDDAQPAIKPMEASAPVGTTEIEVVWEPIANSSQALAIVSPAQHTLYHGARGPGKTITQLMRYRSRVGLGYGSYWRGIIFDREFKNLSDLVAQSKRFFPKFDDGCTFHESATSYKWVWPTGEELYFRHVKKLDDYDAFHGHEYPFLGWNELTKHPTGDLYDKFMSVNRSSFVPEKHTPKRMHNGKPVYDTPNGLPLPPIPLEVFSTTNPSGPGHNWVKKKFINVAKSGEILRTNISYFDPIACKEVEVIRTQVAIFGSFYENPYLDPVYRAGLIESCRNDPHLYAAWIKGSWDVSAGGAFDDLWNSKIHIIDYFKIPSNWKVDRSFDWGSSHPYACIWWAESNGEEITFVDSEKKRCFPRGTLIAIYELYGASQSGTNKGNKKSAKDIALDIVQAEKLMQQWEMVSSKIYGGPADNQIRDVRESDVDTIEYKMAQEGIHWSESDKSKGSRVIGLQLFRERLQASLRNEGPGVYFMRTCPLCIEILPTLPRDTDKPDDVDTESEDHLWDAARYRILKGSNKWATQVKTRWAK